MKTNLIPMMAAAVLALGGAAARGEATLSLVDAADRATAVVDPATGGVVAVRARIDAADGPVAGFDAEIALPSPLEVVEIGGTSAALGGAEVLAATNGLRANCISLDGGEPVSPTTGAAMMSFTVRVPAGTPEGRYEVGLGPRCGIYADGTSNTCAVAVAPLGVVVAATDPVRYLDPVGGGTTNVCASYTPYFGQNTLTTGWYVVEGALTNGARIVVSGDVNLLLMDHAELAALQGINVAAEGGVTNRLAVWAQSDAAAEGNAAGRLVAVSGDGAYAGIGGDRGETAGAIAINGGAVRAVGGDAGAGLGYARPLLDLERCGGGTVDLAFEVVWYGQDGGRIRPDASVNCMLQVSPDGGRTWQHVRTTTNGEAHSYRVLPDAYDVYDISVSRSGGASEGTWRATLEGLPAVDPAGNGLLYRIVEQGPIAVGGATYHAMEEDDVSYTGEGPYGRAVFLVPGQASVTALDLSSPKGNRQKNAIVVYYAPVSGAPVSPARLGGAGIGGGYGGDGGLVAVNGGTVEAVAGNGAQAIGHGVAGAASGPLSIDGVKAGYADDPDDIQWVGAGEREACCRNRDGRTVRLEVCFPHEFDGADCRWCGAPAPTVSDVVARQRWPWNGYVDVDYELGGTTKGFAARISFAEQGGAGRVWVATNFLADARPSAEPGFHRATWDAKADGATNVIAEAVTATVELVREE